MKKLEIGIVYKHYKGGEYEVIGLARHTETLEDLVIYKKKEDSEFWVRPKAMFLENVIVDGQEVERFKKLD